MKNILSKFLNFSRRMTGIAGAIALLMLSQPLSAQSYTYETEGFESPVWSEASSSSNAIDAETGTWTVAKNNIQTNAVAAYEGTYSLICATKTNALTSPLLENGAGILTYYACKPTGGGRTITVHTSTDKINWSAAVETYTVTNEWIQRRVEINDPEARYITFTINSNGGVYLDNILITSAGAAGLTITTREASEISQTSAVVGGNITNEGSVSIVSRGICYSTTEHPDISSGKIEVEGSTGEYTSTLSNLIPGTTYYVKAYAETEK